MKEEIRFYKRCTGGFKGHFFLLFSFFFLLSFCSSPSSPWTSEQYRAAASALVQRELYSEASEMYERYLHSSVIPAQDIPKVLYQLGSMYQDNLFNPARALGYYTVLKAVYPDQNFNNQLGKRIVACLEKSGRTADAKQALTRITDLVPEPRSDTAGGATVAAEIDGRKITLNEIEQSLGKLPEAALEREQAVSHYVTQILIADAARRKGLQDKPAVQRRLSFVQDQILAQENLREEIQPPSPSDNDLKYYYEANKARYAQGPDSAADMKTLMPKVARDWQMEKQNEMYSAYVNKLLGSDKVKIYGARGNE